MRRNENIFICDFCEKEYREYEGDTASIHINMVRENITSWGSAVPYPRTVKWFENLFRRGYKNSPPDRNYDLEICEPCADKMVKYITKKI